ncbi:LysR family transcriptional regulator [Pseudidiomarina sediminum]|uniref:LysR family transcriptional regulator n=1 Tax=Pseudidiomarina sediminum TaxID=431675 RepID=A0A432Z8J5_9GAMM|nr:LysR family transcriptional regulator [Pseudidiomarina sediminum]MBY6063322.1 LysR family transcriptional regulator [Pseudidiomarina sediminum]RUO74170.1 LysR family transcriptional regulator [Pseudidiomarina sediminum]
MINTLWLRTFCTLAEIKHFTRTAEALHMTQSGVSQHIQKLEEQLETQLLQRERPKFTLTEAGQRLYHEGQRILTSLSNLNYLVTDDPSDAGCIRMLSPGSVGLRLYPQLLALQQQYPKLHLDYRFAPNSAIEQALTDAHAELALMSAKPRLAEIHYEAIASEALLLVTPAAITTPTWQTLLDLGFIDHPDGQHYADALLSANYPEFQHSAQFRKNGFSNQIALLLQPVSMGLGFTVLPAYAVSAFSEPCRIRAHHLANPIEQQLYLCSHQQKVLPNRYHTVITRIKQALYDTSP